MNFESKKCTLSLFRIIMNLISIFFLFCKLANFEFIKINGQIIWKNVLYRKNFNEIFIFILYFHNILINKDEISRKHKRKAFKKNPYSSLFIKIKHPK